MRYERQKRIIVAWLLLLCMVPLSVTKITHRHGREQTSCCAEHSDCCDDHSSTDDPCTCQICKFTLSPFVSVETHEPVLFVQLIPHEPVIIPEVSHSTFIHSFQLRAPPLA